MLCINSLAYAEDLDILNSTRQQYPNIVKGIEEDSSMPLEEKKYFLHSLPTMTDAHISELEDIINDGRENKGLNRLPIDPRNGIKFYTGSHEHGSMVHSHKFENLTHSHHDGKLLPIAGSALEPNTSTCYAYSPYIPNYYTVGTDVDSTYCDIGNNLVNDYHTINYIGPKEFPDFYNFSCKYSGNFKNGAFNGKGVLSCYAYSRSYKSKFRLLLEEGDFNKGKLYNGRRVVDTSFSDRKKGRYIVQDGYPSKSKSSITDSSKKNIDWGAVATGVAVAGVVAIVMSDKESPENTSSTSWKSTNDIIGKDKAPPMSG